LILNFFKQKKKPKYIIKTADEVLIEDFENGGDRSKNQGYSVKHSVVSGVSTSKIKIIDMTGKEQKILQGYESLSKRHNKPDDQNGQPIGKNGKRLFDLPELMHNLDVLVNLTEDKIFQSDRQ
jgi:tuftelin-interacting protein 11